MTTVSGTVTGLLGQSLFLTLNAEKVVEDLQLSPGATAFAFTSRVLVGGAYQVFVSDQPVTPRQDCEVTVSGTGLAPEGGVNDVSIVCNTRTAKLSGSLSGLTSTGLVLRNTSNGVSIDLSVPANAMRFGFSEYPDLTPFSVTIVAQPAGLYCELFGGQGMMNVETVLQGVQVKCEPTFAISGFVYGGSGATDLALTSDFGNEVSPVGPSGLVSFATRLPEGAGFTVSVVTQPADRHCNVLLPNTGGVMGNSDFETLTIACVGQVTPALPAFTVFGAWAKNDVDPCDASALTRSACFHAAEKLRVVVPGLTSCTDVVVSDALNAFEWSCRELTGAIEIHSVMLRPGKKLSDLLDFNTNAWKKNSMLATIGDVMLTSKESSEWWTNPISVLGALDSVTTQGTIYLVKGSSTALESIDRSVSVNLDSALVVVAPNITLAPLTATVIDWQGSFGWFEGTIAPQVGGTGVALRDLGGHNRFNTLRGVRVLGGAVGIKSFGTSFGNAITDSQMSGQSTQAVDLGGEEQLLRDVVVNNGHGVLLSGARHLVMDSQLTSTSGDALTLQNASDVFVGNCTWAHGEGSAIMASNTTSSSFVNLAIVGARPSALVLNNADNNDFVGLGVFGTGAYVDLNGNSDGSRFVGRIALGGVSGATGVIGISGASGPGISENGTPALGPLVTFSGLNVVNAFVGAVSTDARNLASRNMFGIGATNVAGFDWFNFENTRRSWGIPKSTFDAGAIELGGPAATSAQIWDFSLNPNASGGLRNGNPKPATLAANIQTSTHTTSTAAVISYVRNTVEIIQDGVGNDNGYCEANERCIHTPNLGRAQGKGQTTEAPSATFNTVVGVRLVTSASF